MADGTGGGGAPLVALIDSGVNRDHPHIAGQGEILVPSGDLQSDRLGHGTAAAAAILDLAPRTRLLSIQVFTDKPTCPFADVLDAIDRAFDAGASLVNLSLGTARSEWIAPLEERVERGRAAGARIVSPASWRGLSSYPGSLLHVDGVLDDPTLDRDAPERRTVGGRTWWFASPHPRPIPGVPVEANLHGASMAAANVTGWLAREL